MKKAIPNVASTIEKEIEQAKIYYNNQLSKLDLTGNIQVKFTSLNGDTNYLSINKESIECIIDFLNKLNN